MPRSGLDLTKRKKRNDGILILGLLVVALLCFLFMKMNEKQGAAVKITVDGKLMEEHSLTEDTTCNIGEESSYNIIVIQKGKVTMQEADCPDKICVRHKAISKSGETIVCLPHKVVVEIVAEGDKESQKDFDAISK